MASLTLIFLCLTIVVTTKAMQTTICPKSCKCANKRMKCSWEIPTFIPDRITDVELLDIEVDMYVDGVFCRTTWNNVQHLTLACGDTCQQTANWGNNTFRCLHNLTSIKLMLDHLAGFDKGTFLGLNKVTSLDLTDCQRVCSYDLITALADNTVLPLLSKLILKKIGTVGCSVEIEIDQKLVDILGKRPIYILDLSFCPIVFVHPNLDPLCDTLTSLDISYSTIGKRSKLDSSKCCKSLQVLTLNGAHLPNAMILPFNNTFTNKHASMNGHDQLFLSVNNLYCNSLFSRDYTFVFINSSLTLMGKTNITNLEICGYNFINFDLMINFTENHLRRVALANNSMENIGVNVFRSLTLLSEIDLSNNRLSQTNAFETTFQQLFRKNSLLQKMNLSSNNLTHLHFYTFKSNALLSSLDLSGNKFEQILFDVKSLRHLTLLDMRNNSIIALNAESRNGLDTLYRLQHKTNIKRTFEVDLRGNHLSCDCDALDFVEWFVSSPLFTNKDQYTCHANGRSLSMTDLAIRAAEDDCERPIRRRRTIILAVVVPSITLCCVVGVIIGIIKQRRRLLRNKRFNDRVKLLQDDCVDFRFLVFLSFSSEDDEFVMKQVLTPLQVNLFSTYYHSGNRTFCKKVILTNTYV